MESKETKTKDIEEKLIYRIYQNIEEVGSGFENEVKKNVNTVLQEILEDTNTELTEKEEDNLIEKGIKFIADYYEA